MSNIPQETDDIEVPPFPYSEEEEKVVETHASDPVGTSVIEVSVLF